MLEKSSTEHNTENFNFIVYYITSQMLNNYKVAQEELAAMKHQFVKKQIKKIGYPSKSMSLFKLAP